MNKETMKIDTTKCYQTFTDYDFDVDIDLKEFLIDQIKDNNGVSELIVSDIGENKKEIIANLHKISSGIIYKYDINAFKDLSPIEAWATIIMKDLSKEKELVRKAVQLIKHMKHRNIRINH